MSGERLQPEPEEIEKGKPHVDPEAMRNITRKNELSDQALSNLRPGILTPEQLADEDLDPEKRKAHYRELFRNGELSLEEGLDAGLTPEEMTELSKDRPDIEEPR